MDRQSGGCDAAEAAVSLSVSYKATESTMLRSLARICAIVLSSIGISTVQAKDLSKSEQPLVVRPGDVIVQKHKGDWAVVKVLAVDTWPDGSSTAHCLNYRPMPQKPTMESLQQAPVLIWHAPIHAASFGTGWERIGNQAPTKDEFVGFVEYLKLTDFPRYISFTGLDAKALTRKANEHYQRAYALGSENKRQEAIAEYSKAIELFPLFYEAIDNRAFTYMELGKYREALSDFEESLRVNPEGITAFFSKGECFMKLGDFKAAGAIFKEGKTRFPEQRAMFDEFLKNVQRMRQRTPWAE